MLIHLFDSKIECTYDNYVEINYDVTGKCTVFSEFNYEVKLT